jgi:hypothetical protein
LEHHLTVPNGIRLGPDKQAVLHAVTGLDWTPERARVIRNCLGHEALRHEGGGQ